MLVEEENHLASTRLSLRPKVETLIEWLEQEVADIDQQLEDPIQQVPVFKEKKAILRSAKGVGSVLCAKLLSVFLNWEN